MTPSLTERIIGEFPRMPPRLQAAARFVLDRPQDVALLSMREQARRAGVTPATMTRLAQRLGLGGYDDLRGDYAAAIRNSASYGDKASRLVARRGGRRAEGIAAEMAGALAEHVEALAAPPLAARLAAAADELAAARHIHCLGLRSSFPVAFLFHYVCALAGSPVTLLDGAGATGMDALAAASPEDALMVASVRPYTRLTVEAARQAWRSGLRIVAITDSLASPLAPMAHQLITVGTASPSFFDSKTAAVAAAETLAMLVALRGGKRSLAAVRIREQHLAAMDAYWQPQSRKRSS